MNKGIKVILAVAVIAVVTGVVYIRSNKNTVAIQASTIDNTIGIEKILGVKGVTDDTGVTSITDLNNQYAINYTYSPNFNNNIIDEIGYQLSNRIEQVYAKYPDVDKLNFIINLQFFNDGILVNKPYIQFTTTKSTFAKINWNTYNYSQLLDIASNVKSISDGLIVHNSLNFDKTNRIKTESKDAMNTQKLGQD